MADIDLVGLLQGKVGVLHSDLDATARSQGGVTLGVVTSIDDPQGLGRVKVKLLLVSPKVESAWARVAVPWAGQRRGSYLLPEVDDEVVVAFRHGDINYPYVLGFLWSDRNRPPESSPKLNRRELRSKKGGLLLFDDNDGKERTLLRSKSGLEVVLDDGAGKLRVSSGGLGQTIKIEIDTNGKSITITSPTGNISLQAPQGEVAIDASTVRVQASAGLTLSGQPVNINPPTPALPSVSAGVA